VVGNWATGTATANSRGGGVRFSTIYNTIVYSNTGGTSGGNNIDGSIAYNSPTSNPVFADGGYQLASNSPYIGAGINSYATAALIGSYDLAGNPRTVCGTVDIGAYEFTATYNVTFNGNTGSPASQTVSQTYGNTYVLPTTSPTRTGYDFTGWFTATSGGLLRTASTTVTNTTVHTLYAQWNPRSYTVTYDPQSGTVSPLNKVVTFASTYGTLATPTRSGWTFAGWFTAASGGTQVTSSTTVTTASDHRIYARWNPTIGTAVNNTSLTWTTGGNLPWFGQVATSHDGLHAAQSGAITHNQSSWVETTVSGSGKLTFWWHVSSEGTAAYPCDNLACTINGILNERITGTTGNWAQKTIPIPTTGTSTIRWTYSKDVSVSQGSDCGWLDEVVWTPISSVTVTFDGNNGTPSTQTVIQTPGSPYRHPSSNPTRPGYTFAGWWTAISGGTQVTTTTTMTNLDPHTLYARWTPIIYRVEFDPQDGTVSPTSRDISFDSQYGTLPTPTRTGHTFVGWFIGTHPSCTLVTPSTILTTPSNHTLHAHWTVLSVFVTFVSNGGTPESETIIQIPDLNYNLPPPPSRPGYTFVGWFTTATGGTQVTGSTTVPPTAHTLYARWTANTYTVRFNSGGGSGAMADQAFTYDVAQALRLNAFSRSGYTFAGWMTNGTAVAFSNGQTVINLTTIANAMVTLTALWTAQGGIVVTYNYNGATGGMSGESQTVTYDGTYGTLPNPTRTGYTFDGWFTAQTGGTQVTTATTVTQATAHTLHARWTANTYTVRFDGGGGAGTMADQAFTYDTPQALRLSTFLRTGYNFTGWMTNGTAVAFSDGQTVSNLTTVASETVTLTAQWAAQGGIVVTYNYNGATGGMSGVNKTVTYDGTYGMLPNPTRTGYTFAGWFTALTGGMQVDATTPVTRTDGHTLYAQWVEVPSSTTTVSVTFLGNNGIPSSQTVTQTVGDNYILPTPDPTRDGYTFNGWFTDPYSGTQVFPYTLVTQTTDHTLYAQWSEGASNVSVTVTFLGNGGTPSSQTVPQTVGENYILPTPDPTRDGYTFNGWFDPYSGTQVFPYTLVTQTTAHTLYAVWTDTGEPLINPDYTIVFYANGGEGTMTPQPFVVAATMVLKLNEFTQTGYTFANWMDKDGATYGDGATVVTAVMLALANEHGVVALTAQWTEASPNPPSTPTGVSASQGTYTDRVIVSWSASTDATSYTVFRNTVDNSGNASQIGTSTATSYSDTTAVAGTAYYYWVRASNSSGNSGFSASAQGWRASDGTPPPQDPYLSDPEEEGSAPNVTTAYDGFVYDAGNTVRGTLTLNAKVSKGVWTVSAKVILQGATLSFSAKQSGPLTSIVLHKNGATLALTLGRDRFDGTLEGGAAGGVFTVCGARNDQMDRLAGLYNVALLSGGGIPAAVAGGTDTSAAMGYLSLSVGKKNTVKIAGQLADGTKVSGSTKLLKGLSVYNNWYGITLFKPLYKKAGFIGGLLWLDPQPTMNNPSQSIIRVDTDYNWYVDWKKASGGFAERLDVVGGYFGTGKAAVMPPPGLTFGADVPGDLPTLAGPWQGEKFPSGVEVFISGGKPSFAKKGPSNPSGATLSYNAKTGVFKGKFSLFSTDFSGREKATGVPYAGAFVPQDGALTGFGTGTATINKVKYGIPVYLEK